MKKELTVDRVNVIPVLSSFCRPTEAIIFKTYLTDCLKKSQNFRIGRSLADTSADTSADEKGLIQIRNGPIIGQLSADHRPIMAKTQKLSADGKKIITR